MDDLTKFALLKIAAPCAIIVTIGTLVMVDDTLKARRAERMRRLLSAEKLRNDLLFRDLAKAFYDENPHLRPKN